MRFALCGGGTGGHVYPALSIALALRQELEGREPLQLQYLASRSPADAELIARYGTPATRIASGPVRGRRPWDLALNLGRLAWGFRQAQGVFRRFQPQALLSTGGYASVPIVLAAARARIPIVLYLPDIHPGWAVRLCARYADRVAVTAKEALDKLPKGKGVVTGYPVRPEFGQAQRADGRRLLGIDPEEKVLLVAGASQGARHLNEAVATNLLGLLKLCEVVHLSGRAHEARLVDVRGGLPLDLRTRYHLYGYMYDELPLAMAAADLAVCRAGASVMGELPAIGLPAVLVPYPYAGGHQKLNARYLERNGAATVVEDEDLQPQFLPLVGSLLSDEPTLRRMAASSRALARPQAAANIARLLLEVATPA
ncbi:MAG TPA: UDP-N-acetylglucosamine--N-acetylmuramyl-(pentapeptide) pyrophosphoryl-undecaprenol N-acetylglucosamine transferase [Dehalococcoidia bacterium]|nr:UDP-N-acetylglucosamine--N-acetylmuramyl-(pentapeptide) pyrophosphoryl-undecaprenol N-acetylglucosamine transferase [Dehalococcoidia bacterium]